MISSDPRPLNAEQLAARARELAERHVAAGALGRRPIRPLVDRIESSREDIDRLYDYLVGAARRGDDILPAGEWILDNYYIIREQFLRIRQHLTKGFYRKLPKLPNGELRGYPRVFEVVLELASSTANVLDEEGLFNFVNAYQDVELLSLGELWAVPVMVRIVTIDRLEGLSGEILKAHEIREAADDAAKQLIAGDSARENESGARLGAVESLEDLQRSPFYSENIFPALVIRSLETARGLGAEESRWIDREFARRGTNLDAVLDESTRRQSERQVSVSNAIKSLQHATEADWSRLVESLSVVEQTLRLDPTGIYPEMDFKTRDRYRGRIEHLAEHSDASEFDVARTLLELSENGESCGGLPQPGHIGWMLLEECRSTLESEIGYRIPYGERLKRWVEMHPGWVYFAPGVLMFVATILIPVRLVIGLGGPPWMIVLAAVASFLPAWDVSMAILNWIVSMAMPPRILSRMSFRDGIPHDQRAVVVVPTQLGSVEHARQQVEQLEIRAIANPDPNLRYALLTALPDAPEAEMPEDDAIVNAAADAIRALNERRGGPDTFFLLHRDRRWNPGEGVWMEWERKRGKLEEFNRLLGDLHAETTFSRIEGDFSGFVRSGQVPYVITLDADTRLPSGAARDLVRIAAHPFNVPVLQKRSGTGSSADTGYRVRRGYAVLQPRISIVPEEARRTAFARLFTGNVGIDPYTTAVSDTYQDLFAEGIYTGKGLYHPDVFRALLDGVFPENSVLSHDLLEGSVARTALVTDVELFDGYPSTYAAYARRMHRWIRGDWQLLPWILGSTELHIPPMGRFKMLDNLRRSLSMPGILLFFLVGWVVLPGSAARWTLLGLFLVSMPVLLGAGTVLLSRPTSGPGRRKLSHFGRNMVLDLARAGLTVTVLPDMARVSMDAVLRTLWRLTVSRHRLLEWTTAYEVERRGQTGVLRELSIMWPNPATGILLFFTAVVSVVAVPFIVVWVAGPILVWRLGRVRRERAIALSQSDERMLRITARKTWAFFDRTIGPPESWLPPDNLQVKPSRGIARRTSPTNMGLALLAVQAAHDMGYITTGRLLGMLEHMLRELHRLDRYHGHFYNWYETEGGSVLRPRYVSTVDSGNLLAALIVLREGILELVGSQGEAESPSNDCLTDGLDDILGALQEEIEHHSESIAPNIQEEIDGLIGSIRTLAAESDSIEPGRTSTASDSASPSRLHAAAMTLRSLLEPLARKDDTGDLAYWSTQPLDHIDAFCGETAVSSTETVRRGHALVDLCDGLAVNMDFAFLFDKARGLFSIGFNQDRMALDPATYDLFASEARVASYLAIARGDVPASHWFRLSRRLTDVDGGRALVSWGGTMFEYLMPLLFMKRYEHSLLDETYQNVLRAQVELGRRRRLPWGMSESGYNALNLDLDYQYRAFGVPNLGLKRGLAQDYVVAPYATLLAVGIDPESAIANLHRLRQQGAYGSMGFYEAVDFTRERRQPDDSPGVVFSYMAHHQGMALLSIANLLYGNVFQRRFHASPLVLSTELLLQERLPDVIELTTVQAVSAERGSPEGAGVETAVDHVARTDLDGPHPRTLLLTNGRLHTAITAAGGGYTAFGENQLTSFIPDRVADEDGLFIYVRDLDRGSIWSAGHQPVQREPDRYDAWLHINKFESARVDDWIETFTEVCVSPLDDVELRRITLTNYSDERRRLEVTSFAGVTLLDRRSFEDHPAFHKLFVQTEFLNEFRTLLVHRRPRRTEDGTIWMIHGLIEHDGDDESVPVLYETDRAAFVGRGRTPARPQRIVPPGGAAPDRVLRGTGMLGSVLDPAVSLSWVVELAPGEHTQLTFTTGAAVSREKAVRLADLYDNPYAVERAFDLAHAYGLIQLQNFDLRASEAILIQRLSGAMVFGHPGLRADACILEKNLKKQPNLWPYGISGDLPLVVVHIPDEDHLPTVRFMVAAHGFWAYRGLHVDLLLVNESGASYLDDMGDRIRAIVESSGHRTGNDRGVVVVRRSDEIPDDDMALLHTVARMVIRGDIPDPVEIAKGLELDTNETSTEYTAARADSTDVHRGGRAATGSFSEDGREFIVRLPGGSDGPSLPPMPWSNVIANDRLGFLVTERGGGATWSRNSRENRLTPWSNDPVCDPVEEAIYIRDEDANVFWSPTPGPAPDGGAYEVRHGFGRTVFVHEREGLNEEVMRFVDVERPVKFTRLRLSNQSPRERRLTVFFYDRLVLGVTANRSAPYVLTEFDASAGMILARNPYNNEFADLVAGASLIAPDGCDIRCTTDRAEFLGRHGRLDAPEAVRSGRPLEGTVGAGLDPCAAFELDVRIPAEETRDVTLLIGQTDSRDEFAQMVSELSQEGAVESALDRVHDQWLSLLSRLTVRTPSPTLDELVNGWLQYQNIACRLTGRTAFYQSGGALGYRDQLQDAAALLAIQPERTRHQILVHAARQFREGDVQHWWHQPTGRGVRTRITDDLLWLPWATAEYLAWTGDESILAERVPFLEGPTLTEDEHERYFTPVVSGETATILEHCCRAIDRSLTSGAHGFPLIGTGDWNDGMDRVGDEGRGESVWLGFFLVDILQRFLPVCEQASEDARVEQYREAIERLKKAIEGPGWDGDWYRRAFYDDGTPLGSAEADECRIDAIAQAWSVLSGAAPDARATRAMQAVEQHLVDPTIGIIRLLTPPFDRTDRDPGYIKGYVPGVRENGGQYTHAAMWVIQAFTRLGQGTKAVELLDMILPPNRASTPEGQRTYQVEPYAVAADIYGVPPHTGRGGWTWYTGSAGWMYRVVVESILGLSIDAGQRLVIEPCIPAGWNGFEADWRMPGSETLYRIVVTNADGVQRGVRACTVDGHTLQTDGTRAVVELGAGASSTTEQKTIGIRVEMG